MRICGSWRDYELLDATDGERLERWGSYILIRPDPQIIWKTGKRHPLWKNPNAVYSRSASGGGAWNSKDLPKQWEIGFDDLRFLVKPMNFKHTGIFPEQGVNWELSKELINGKPLKLLNLFAYTGASTIAAAKAGAKVTHIDAAKGMVSWARENAALNGVEARFLIDDCVKFLKREIRRNNFYDALILDPPSYGRGPSGEIWKLEDGLYDLLTLCAGVLKKDSRFVFLNAYTSGLAPGALKYIMEAVFVNRFGGHVEAYELGLPVTVSGSVLPCGATAKWICS